MQRKSNSAAYSEDFVWTGKLIKCIRISCLAVWRAVFDDAAQTWYHIDPVTGDILGRLDATRRGYRWVFNALHSLDFPWLLAHRPTWDILVWLLSMAGLIVSVSGVVIGWRYLRRIS